MAIRFKILWAMLLCSLTISPATAAQLWNSLVLSAGHSKAQNACTSPWVSGAFNPGASCSEGHAAYRFAYSRNFTPVWGVEISYGDLGDAEGVGTFVIGGAPATWSMKSVGWAFAGTGTFPIGKGFTLLGKIGGVRAEFREEFHSSIATAPVHGVSYNGIGIISGAKNGLLYGVGLQYDLNNTYAIRAQYENFGKYTVYDVYGVTTPKISLSMVSVGLVLKF